MVEISKSGSGEGLGGVIPRGYPKKTLRGWGGLTRTSRDPPQEPRYRDEVEGPSHV